MSCESTRGIFDSHVAFKQPTACEGPAGDMPDAIVDVLEAAIFPDAGDGNVDPLTVLTDATVGADVAHLEAVGILERW